MRISINIFLLETNKLRLCLLLTLALFASDVVWSVQAGAADRYWVGGTGNWSDDANHWATSSGGAGGSGNKPGISDTAIFDSNSGGEAQPLWMKQSL